MILLRLLSWPYLRKHVLRWSLTLFGIVLGVAVFVAMHTANQSVMRSFSRTVDRIAGATQLQVEAGDFGFEESVLERVQNVPEVRVAVPVIEAVVDSGLRGQGNLLILGVDMLGDRSLRDYDLDAGNEDAVEDPLVFLAQPDSLILAREFAARNGLALNSRLVLETMEGPKRFVVRGLMRSGGLSGAFGGNLAVMDVYSAQKMFGRGRRFDRIDVGVKEGVPLAQCQAAIKRVLGPGFEVEPPSARGQHFESMISSYSLSMSVSSIFALIIGLFIIYNSFSIAVTQRRAEIGVLRALGASRGQVRALFLGESLVAGLLGSLLGAGAGMLLARGIAVYIGGFMQQVYGVAQNVEEISVEPWLITAAVAVGTLTSLVAAWLPARAAARVDPVQALQKGRYQVLSAGESRARALAALVFALFSAGCLMLGSLNAVFYAGYASAILAALLLTPTASHWLARLVRPLLRRLRPVEGALAADSLLQAPRRTSATVSALMLSLAMVIGFGGVARSIYFSVVEWLDTALNPDLFVTPSENLANRTYSFPGEFSSQIAALPGVDQTQTVRSARVLFRGIPVTVVAVETLKLGQKVHRRAIQGNLSEAYRLAAQGRGALISDSFAGLRGVHYGDMLELPTPNGVLRLPVVAVTRDYSDQQGSILIDRGVYQAWWNDDSANIIRVYLKPGAPADQVKRRILERFAGTRRLFVLSNEQVRRHILALTDQWFGMTYNQVSVAILVAVLGIVNTLTVSITDRRRELGVLQAVGGLRRQIRHTIWMEALAIALVGLVLGLALGALNLFYTLGLTQRDFAGMRLDYMYPIPLALLLAPIILGAALAAAIGPAESAVRGSLVEALEYE